MSPLFSQNDMEVAITRDLVRPANLKKGDTIIILSPGGKLKDRSAVDQGIELANHWGLVVFFGNQVAVASSRNYTATAAFSVDRRD